ncbi:DUF4402 domain-containing protein [Sphingomonas paeninsulae]|uniref:DUF4402 domain-containing protein n=1 Tax=Sphingomonas paeninsulae TaxID=2319844 RepID=A0A494TMG8_SPHPE|nr:DUF4402 domain-containing protein [Sphingomonas paeninsulae]AYJ86628.1 DUF4402 domain-containing protein [Sphingomonas paeninsulae]
MDLRALVFVVFLWPSQAVAQCRLCAPSTAAAASAPSRALTIEIETALDFSRAAQSGRGSGSIAVDEHSGARSVNGLIDLGGMALKGTVVLTGEPFRHVRISLPASIRLSASEGDGADVVDLRTDLSPDPALDASGSLKFSFGGRLIVSSHSSGDLRGRISIAADYQ